MALGARRKLLRGALLRDVATVSLGSAVAGIVLGVPLAVVVWQVFRLFFSNEQMKFVFNIRGLLWPVAFALLSCAAAVCDALRFVRRTKHYGRW